MCMCGALDCEICFPGSNRIVQCDFCGEYMPLHMANREGYDTYFCDDCHGNIRECEGCCKKIHIDDEEFGDWEEDEYKDWYCPKCITEAKEEGVWYV